MKQVVKMLFGSDVYGLRTPSSDHDYKSIFIPTARDIILNPDKNHAQQNTKTDSTGRNTKDDVDHEMFSLKAYLKLLSESQTVALDMLFTPDSFHIGETNRVFNIIRENRDKIISKKVNSFVGYTKQQAAKYGIKGSRVNALKQTIDVLSTLDPELKLEKSHAVLDKFINEFESNSKLESKDLVKWTLCKGPAQFPELHLEVANRKFPIHASAKYCLSILNKIYDEYGHRAKLAETNEGIDWKALSHAIRVADEAEELLLTGNITFPLYNKDYILKVKTGQLLYKEVAEKIEEGLGRIEVAMSKSSLRAEPDQYFIDDLLFNTYSKEFK